jgi:acyl carrier protein
MEDKIIEILQEIRPEFDFSDSYDFVGDGLLDSFDIVQLVDALDKKFQISIDGLDIIPENFNSVRTIVSLIHKNGVRS